jgi:hypothetical protein
MTMMEPWIIKAAAEIASHFSFGSGRDSYVTDEQRATVTICYADIIEKHATPTVCERCQLNPARICAGCLATTEQR